MFYTALIITNVIFLALMAVLIVPAISQSTEDTSMTGESRLFGFDFGDWLMLVVGLTLAGSLTLAI
jgi:hypothetical protein